MNQFHFHVGRARAAILLLALLGALPLVPSVPARATEDTLVVYSGRAERLIKPVLDAFQSKTGIRVQLLSSGTTELVNRLQAEGSRTPADIFITNDAGSLERARELGLLRPLSPSEVEAIPGPYRSPDNSWVGLSGRYWILVYNTARLKPTEISSILELAEPRWKDQIAIPNAGSEYLQAGVSVIKAVYGDEKTKRFLEGLKANAGIQVYGKSSQIVEAVAKGQVPMGLVNHYYIYRHLAAHPNDPIAPLLLDQQPGGMGAILNVAGAGLTKHAHHVESARRLMEFLISPDGQGLFAELNKEYPLRSDVPADPALPDRRSIQSAGVPLGDLSRLREPTMSLIERVGLR